VLTDDTSGTQSDPFDVDQIAEPNEVIRIPGEKVKAVGVRGGSDHQIGDTPSM